MKMRASASSRTRARTYPTNPSWPEIVKTALVDDKSFNACNMLGPPRDIKHYVINMDVSKARLVRMEKKVFFSSCVSFNHLICLLARNHE